MTRTILPSGAEILREYAPADRLITETYEDSESGIYNTTHFAYDKAGNLTCITDNQGRNTLIEYDAMNQEIRRTEKDGSVTWNFYNRNGQLVKTIRPNAYAKHKEQVMSTPMMQRSGCAKRQTETAQRPTAPITCMETC